MVRYYRSVKRSDSTRLPSGKVVQLGRYGADLLVARGRLDALRVSQLALAIDPHRLPHSGVGMGHSGRYGRSDSSRPGHSHHL